MRVFILVRWMVLLAMLASGCTAEQSLQRPALPTSAVVQWLDSAGLCRARLRGSFVQGQALDSARQGVQLLARVRRAGSHEWRSDSLRGFFFQNRGAAMDTGLRWVDLGAVGKPTDSGLTSFAVAGACRFSVPVLAMPPAKFIMLGSPNNCGGLDVKGRYQVGRTPAANDTVMATADVRQPGPYAFRTDTVGGLWFEASGFFATPGYLPVRLLSKGLPQRGGSLGFQPQLSTGTCEFMVAVANAVPEAAYRLDTLVGPGNECVFTQQGQWKAGQLADGSQRLNLTVQVAQPGHYTVLTPWANGLRYQGTAYLGATGAQNMILTGEGRPVAAGNTPVQMIPFYNTGQQVPGCRVVVTVQ